MAVRIYFEINGNLLGWDFYLSWSFLAAKRPAKAAFASEYVSFVIEALKRLNFAAGWLASRNSPERINLNIRKTLNIEISIVFKRQ